MALLITNVKSLYDDKLLIMIYYNTRQEGKEFTQLP